MTIKEQLGIYFWLLPDKRNQHYTSYKLNDIMLLFMCGMLCGLRDFEEIHEMLEARWDSLREHVDCEKLPCARTFANVISHLDPARLELCLQGIFRNVFAEKLPENSQISIDGKAIRGVDIQVVTAYSNDGKMSLGQVVINKKKSEIKAVQELLDMLDLRGKVVTFDAMHCPKETLAKVVEKKGDYVVQVKKNQGALYDDICGLFRLGNMVDEFETSEKGHGRFETRICRVLSPKCADGEYFAEWSGLQTIFSVERRFEKNGVISEETSYYISSLNATAEELLRCTRKHWEIESFHWVLDVVCREDKNFKRIENTQICMNIMRKFAVSMMKKYIAHTKPKKTAISANMRKCLFNAEILIDLLAFFEV